MLSEDVPPLAVDGVRQVADVEHEDRRVDEAPELIEERVRLRVAVEQPEWDREEQTDENRERKKVVPLVVREELGSERAHSDGCGVVLLDDPAGPL